MKFSVLGYEGGNNIGDDIQSIAAARLLPSLDCRIHRDRLHEFSDPDRHLLVMNGWFCFYPEQWPPAASVLPLFYSFHATKRVPVWDSFSRPEMLEYFRRYQPIGCRDADTAEKFRALGIESYYSKCLTLTLPRREDKGQLKNGKVFVVDAGHIPIPAGLAGDAIQISHNIPTYIDNDTRWSTGQQLLDVYRDQARLVITTRLHCALPCAAMGIPVVFFGDPLDHRIAVAADIGLPIYSHPLPMERALLKWGYKIRRTRAGVPRAEPEFLYRKPMNAFVQSGIDLLQGLQNIRIRTRRDINWEPAPLDMESQKNGIIEGFHQALRKCLADQR